MEENIFDLLEEWNYAIYYGDKEREREVGHKIEVLKKAYREGQRMEGDVKIVGVFMGNMCSVHVNDIHIATIFDLKYSGVGSDLDDARLYTNQSVNLWLDYAVYE